MAKKHSYPEYLITAGPEFIKQMDDALIDFAKGEARRTGRTTRLVDMYVQRLFSEPFDTWIHIEDHVNIRTAGRHTFNIFMRRIIAEHGWLLKSPLFNVDSNNRQVRLKMCPKKFDAVNKRLKG